MTGLIDNLLQPAFFFFVALSLLVLVHEWGHFYVARRLGVRVLKFSIGFGPELLGFTRGETRYSFSAIPFGGFVKFAGENPEEELDHLPDEFLGKSVAVRSAIVIAGPAMNYVFAILLYAAFFYFSGLPTIATTRIGAVTEGSIAEEIGLLVDDEVRSVNGVEVTDWKSFSDALGQVEGGTGFSIEVARSGVPLTLQGQSRDDVRLDWTLGVEPFALARIGDVQRSSPAWDAGLRTGDRIVRLEDQEVESWATMSRIIRGHAGEEIEIAWERDGQIMESSLTPAPIPMPVEGGEPDTVGRIGVGQLAETKKVGVWTALSGGTEMTVGLTVAVAKFLPSIPISIFDYFFRGQKETGLGGPIMMAQVFGEAARWGILQFISKMAFISTQLAILNLLPIPVLDGGHLALYLVEAVTRRPPSMRVKIILQQIGFALLLLLMVSVAVMDVGRLFG